MSPSIRVRIAAGLLLALTIAAAPMALVGSMMSVMAFDAGVSPGAVAGFSAGLLLTLLLLPCWGLLLFALCFRPRWRLVIVAALLGTPALAFNLWLLAAA